MLAYAAPSLWGIRKCTNSFYRKSRYLAFFEPAKNLQKGRGAQNRFSRPLIKRTYFILQENQRVNLRYVGKFCQVYLFDVFLAKSNFLRFISIIRVVKMISYSIIVLGDVNRLQLEHDNSGGSPDWFVKRIKVEDTGSGQSWLFPFNNWISLTQGSRALRQELMAP